MQHDNFNVRKRHFQGCMQEQNILAPGAEFEKIW